MNAGEKEIFAATNDVLGRCDVVKRCLMPLMIAMFLTVAVSTSHAFPAVPPGQQKLELYTIWLNQYSGGWECDLYAAEGKLENCSTKNNSNTIWQYGCALTSLTMLYNYYGLKYMPDPDANYFPKKALIPSDIFMFERLDPGKLDDWLVTYNGYVGTGAVAWDTAVKSFYYYGWPWPDYYEYLHRDYYCSTSDYEWPYYSSKNLACYVVDWTDLKRDPKLSNAQALLDFDLEHNQPDIMKIKGTDLAGRKHDKHFVLVAGYDPASVSYSVYDPGQSYGGDNYYRPRPLSSLYSNYTLLTLYRFVGWESKTSPKISEIRIKAHSPVEMEIIDPMNRRTGYDPDTREKLQENPMSLYYEEESPSSLDGDDVPSEPVKMLTVVEPQAGNYILRIIGTGDGPYTIEMQGERVDGTINLATSFTGIATPSLSETYRVTYSPTGEAALSQTNQAPVANAGTNQTGEQSYEIALDGSASHDPDGDPLKYAWSFVSKPEGSTASLSNVSAVNPTFTPDKPGTHTLQLSISSAIAITPSSGLSTNTNHTTTVSGYAEDVNGSQLDGDRDRLKLKMIFWGRQVYAESRNLPTMRL